VLGGKVLPGDENQDWREEAFGEHPILDPFGNPFHSDAPIEVSGLENPESCDACG
jgi:hypothetical protein